MDVAELKKKMDLPWLAEVLDKLTKGKVIKILDKESLENFVNPSERSLKIRIEGKIKESSGRLKRLYEKASHIIRPYGIDMVDPAEYARTSYAKVHCSNICFNFNINVPFKKFFRGFSIDFILNDADRDDAPTRKKFIEDVKNKGYFSIDHKDGTVVRYNFVKAVGSRTASIITISHAKGCVRLGAVEIHSASYRNDKVPPTLIEGNYIKGISQIIAQYIEHKNHP